MSQVRRAATWFAASALLPLLAVLAVQAVLVGHAFPWADVLSATPMLGIDHPYHLYQVHVAQVLAGQGRLTGYDPFFAAGYTAGVNFNASGKGPALLAWLLRGVTSEGQAYKIYVAAVSVAAPAAAVLAGIGARLGARALWCSAALAVVLWWASRLHWYHTAGMVSFVFASFVTLPYCVALDRVATAPRASGTVLLLGATGALMLLLHPLFVVPVCLFAALRLAMAWPALPAWRWLGRAAAIVVIAVLPNLPWVLAMAGGANISQADYSVSYQVLVDHRLVWMELLGITAEPAHGAKAYPLLVVLALWSLRGQPASPLCRVFFASWAALVLFAAFGAALPLLPTLQPNRFSSAAYLMLIVPASAGVVAVAAAVREGHGPRRVLAIGSAVLALLLALVCANEVRREASYAPTGRYGAAPPEVRGAGPKTLALLDWLATTTRPEGRVLFETSLGRVHDGGHVAGYLALQSGRELIGGPYNNFFVGTRDGWMFGRPLAQITPEQFRAYLRLYNIGWIAVHSEAAKRYLAALGEPVQPGAAFEGLQTYRVRQPLDFVQAGNAVVRSREVGRLVVEQRGAAGSSIVLKYHHVPGLRASDGSVVEPVFLQDDPDPFIKVTPKGAVVELLR